MRLLVQQRHVQVPPRAPPALGDELEPGGDEHEGGIAVGEGAGHPRPASDLAVEPLDGVVGPDLRQCSRGNLVYVSVSARPSMTILAASFIPD